MHYRQKHNFGDISLNFNMFKANCTFKIDLVCISISKPKISIFHTVLQVLRRG